jgi:outer membrane cobalamin receptor
MIDGRRSYLSAADLQNMLQGMSADNIKTIEIINNPSAKYDANGNAGIINIILKKEDAPEFEKAMLEARKSIM